MKKLLYLLAVVFATIVMNSCSHVGQCQVNYTVCYPDTTITYEEIFNYKWDGCGCESDDSVRHTPRVTSSEGTNFIQIGYSRVFSSTCPVRINSYENISYR